VQPAVVSALHYDRLDLALQWLEQGRCLVWNQLNQLRTPIDNLCVRSSSLADHFVQVASALESYGTRSSSILSHDSTLQEHIHIQDLTCKHTILAAEYKQLLKKFGNFQIFMTFFNHLIPLIFSPHYPLKVQLSSSILTKPNVMPWLLLLGLMSLCIFLWTSVLLKLRNYGQCFNLTFTSNRR
jgi:hypothetical protein